MTLFLASNASKTLDLLLPLLPKSPHELKLAFIPTARDPYKETPWIDVDRQKVSELGFTIIDVDLKDKTENEIRKLLADVDIIFVAGGNTFYLLEKVKKSGFDKVVKELIQKGIIYIGSSAGSVIMGPDIESVKVFDDMHVAKLDSFEGLNLVDFVVLPHYKKGVYEKEHNQAMEEYKGKYKFILLTDEQAVLVTDSGYKVVES